MPVSPSLTPSSLSLSFYIFLAFPRQQVALDLHLISFYTKGFTGHCHNLQTMNSKLEKNWHGSWLQIWRTERHWCAMIACQSLVAGNTAVGLHQPLLPDTCSSPLTYMLPSFRFHCTANAAVRNNTPPPVIMPPSDWLLLAALCSPAVQCIVLCVLLFTVVFFGHQRCSVGLRQWQRLFHSVALSQLAIIVKR